MKESDAEGLANHNGPELCGGGGNIAAEALAGVRVGTVLSPEIRTRVSGADRLFVRRRQHVARRKGKECDDLAGSETRSMRGSNLDGNREALQLAPEDCAGVRTVNPKGVRL
jgi:hypothetical protein